MESEKFVNRKVIANYAGLLNQFYKIKLSAVYPLIRRIVDSKQGLTDSSS
jgi:hypothetical protein